MLHHSEFHLNRYIPSPLRDKNRTFDQIMYFVDSCTHSLD